MSLNMNRISTLSLWLDALDTNFISYNTSNQVSRWQDKSSNNYQFQPLRSDFPPIWSTNSILFSPSSFQLFSDTAIPVTSTTDTFVVLSPTLLNGPRQPFFDNADFTASETDGRINTQVYADGREYFHQVYANGYTMGSIVYKGDLYTTTYTNSDIGNVNTIPNYLQKYNPNNITFERFLPASTLMTTQRSLSVYNGQLVIAGDSFLTFYNASNGAVFSTNRLSSTTYAPIVYNNKLYVTSGGYLYTPCNATAYPQLYQYQDNSNFAVVSSMQAYLNAGNAGYYQTTCNAVTYNGTLWFMNWDNINSGSITRLQGLTYNSNSLSNGTIYGATVFNGNLTFARNDIRIWKYEDQRSTFITTSRLNYGVPNGCAMVAYKGNLVPLKLGTGTSNTIDFLSGESNVFAAGGSLFTQTGTGYTNLNINTSNGMIVHDGKLFFSANNNGYTYAYGNGTTLDSPVSTGQMLLMFRKSPTLTQLWVNGSLAVSRPVNFTYDRQVPRRMYIGGAAGMLNSAFSDPGTDHLHGCIYSYTQYQSNLNTANRQVAEGLLSWRFGLQGNLPASHPYAFSSP
jgi:hypothetical protein